MQHGRRRFTADLVVDAEALSGPVFSGGPVGSLISVAPVLFMTYAGAVRPG